MSSSLLLPQAEPATVVFNADPFPQLKNELEFLEKEVTFYRKLLWIAFHNCGSTRDRLQVKNLLHSFQEYEESIFPNIRVAISKMSSRDNSEEKRRMDFREKINRHKMKLNGLKKQVFPLSIQPKQVRFV